MVAFLKVGRLVNVAWIVLHDGRKSGLSIVPTGSDFVDGRIVFRGYRIVGFDGAVAPDKTSFVTLAAAKQRAEELVASSVK